MRRQAETHAEEDQHRRDLIEARNTADNAVYNAEKTLQDLGDKVPAEIKTNVETAIAQVRSVRDHEDRPKSITQWKPSCKLCNRWGRPSISNSSRIHSPTNRAVTTRPA